MNLLFSRTLLVLLTFIIISIAVFIVSPNDSSAASGSVASTSAAIVAPNGFSTWENLSILEKSYFSKNGKFQQILPGNKLPVGQSGTVLTKLGQNLRSDISITTYETPLGKGFQVFFVENGTNYSFGYGPEAQDRTYSSPVPVAALTATSTAQ